MKTEPMDKIDKKQQRQGRLVFLLMIIFFAVPILVVLGMYKFDWRPAAQNNGELINPPKKLELPVSLKTSDGAVVERLWADRWNMVYVAKECTLSCAEKLHLMRQIHVSLYKDIPRVQRVLITEQADITQIKQDYPDLVVINQPIEAVSKVMRNFEINGEHAESANRIYLVDPLANLVMSYRPDMKGEAIRKDLVHLLKYSWAG